MQKKVSAMRMCNLWDYSLNHEEEALRCDAAQDSDGSSSGSWKMQFLSYFHSDILTVLASSSPAHLTVITLLCKNSNVP